MYSTRATLPLRSLVGQAHASAIDRYCKPGITSLRPVSLPDCTLFLLSDEQRIGGATAVSCQRCVRPLGIIILDLLRARIRYTYWY